MDEFEGLDSPCSVVVSDSSINFVIVASFSQILTWLFVCVFQTAEGLQNALDKDKVYIKGVRIQKEPSSSTPRSVDRSLSSNGWAVDFRSPKTTEQSSGSSFASMPKSEGFRGASFKVAVEGIPVSIPLSEVQRALSKYGEIILSDMKQDNFGAYCATLEFKVINFSIFSIWVLLCTDRCVLSVWAKRYA